MKNKNLLVVLFIVPMLLISFSSNAQRLPDWFYTTVITGLPSFGPGSYGIIKITNTDFTSDYYSYDSPTIVLDDLGSEVKVDTSPGEAYVTFMCNEGSYTGSVHASVKIYDVNGNEICYNTGGVGGTFYYGQGATIIMDNTWIYK